MIVVSDACPLIHLSLVGAIDLLPGLYHRVLIPDLVYGEVVTSGQGLAGSSEVAMADWIDVADHDPAAHLFRLLRKQLDPGEAAAIWLSIERRSRWLLSDDRPARLAAEALGLPVKGTLGVLVEAKRAGLVPAVSPLLRQLQHYGVWLSEDLISRVLQSLDEAE